jgi:hypothetical protein
MIRLRGQPQEQHFRLRDLCSTDFQSADFTCAMEDGGLPPKRLRQAKPVIRVFETRRQRASGGAAAEFDLVAPRAAP